MELHLPKSGHLLCVGSERTIKQWADRFPGQVLGLSRSAKAEVTGCRVIVVSDELEDLVKPSPVFSAVIFDSTDENYSDYEWDGTRSWLSSLVTPGGRFIYYGIPDSMPNEEYWRWSRVFSSHAIDYCPTDEKLGLDNICCAITLCSGFNGMLKIPPAIHDVNWYNALHLSLPVARRAAVEFDRTEYTVEEFATLAKNDTGLFDMACHGYKMTSLERPPLELGIGHLGLLIASGQLAGRIQTRGREPHVMRGVSRKVERTHINEAGRQVTTEQVEILVRTVDGTGKIVEYIA